MAIPTKVCWGIGERRDTIHTKRKPRTLSLRRSRITSTPAKGENKQGRKLTLNHTQYSLINNELLDMIYQTLTLYHYGY